MAMRKTSLADPPARASPRGPRPARNRIAFEIAGLTIEALLASPRLPLILPVGLRPFASAKAPDLSLRVQIGPPPLPLAEPPAFEGGESWRLYRNGGADTYVLLNRLRRPPETVVAIIHEGWRSGEIYVQPRAGEETGGVFPLEYPLDQLLLMRLLARRGGLLVHACAVVNAGRGLLFSGFSGAGKSTLARLWQQEGRAVVLTDERAVLRAAGAGRGYRIYGTPWHGDAAISLPAHGPLHALFILDKGATNRAIPLRPAAAAAQLLARSFVPLWDRGGMEQAVETLAQVCRGVACYRLEFAPDSRVLQLIREITA